MLKMKSPIAFTSAFALTLGIAAMPARADLIFQLGYRELGHLWVSRTYATVDAH
jgi:hypothetical protein